jgi:hypothetical protein
MGGTLVLAVVLLFVFAARRGALSFVFAGVPSRRTPGSNARGRTDVRGGATLGSRPPNFIIFYTDDQGWGDIGYNSDTIRTPFIDSLAGAGVRFTNFYSQPLCTPSRGSLLTGASQAIPPLCACRGLRSRRSCPLQDSIHITWDFIPM